MASTEERIYDHLFVVVCTFPPMGNHEKMSAPTSSAGWYLQGSSWTGPELPQHSAACWESCVSIILFFFETPPPPNAPLKTSPRPLPSCRALRPKTGTDLVKKQEVMKSGLEPLYFLPPIWPSKFHDTSFTQGPPNQLNPIWNKDEYWLCKWRWRRDYATAACHNEGIYPPTLC